LFRLQAAMENMDMKKDIFSRLGKCPLSYSNLGRRDARRNSYGGIGKQSKPSAILASNTSSLPITPMGVFSGA
jgi:3-hydroxyacyl-CoA dehydrogenase